MRILLCFSCDHTWEKKQVVAMPRCPKVGDVFESGEQSWVVKESVPTTDDPNHDAILRLRLSGAQPGEQDCFRITADDNLNRFGGHNLLHVDDDDGDEFFFRRAVAKSQVPLKVRHVWNGSDALKYLRGEGPFSDRELYPFPEALVLDLKMPGISGFEVLDRIRSSPGLSRLLVIVLTASSMYKDKERVMALGANAFLTKTVLMERIPETVLLLLERHHAGKG